MPDSLQQWVDAFSDRDIPSLESTANQVSELLAKPSASYPQLQSLVGRDPGFTLFVYRRYQERFPDKPVRCLSHAMSLMGMGALEDIAAELPVMKPGQEPCVELPALYSRSERAARYAQAWAETLDLEYPDEMGHAALLHDCGEIAVSLMSHEHMCAIHALCTQGLDLQGGAQQTLGFTFNEFSHALIRSWRLPNLFQDVTENCWQTGRRERGVKLALALAHDHEAEENPERSADLIEELADYLGTNLEMAQEHLERENSRIRAESGGAEPETSEMDKPGKRGEIVAPASASPTRQPTVAAKPAPQVRVEQSRPLPKSTAHEAEPRTVKTATGISPPDKIQEQTHTQAKSSAGNSAHEEQRAAHRAESGNEQSEGKASVSEHPPTIMTAAPVQAPHHSSAGEVATEQQRLDQMPVSSGPSAARPPNPATAPAEDTGGGGTTEAENTASTRNVPPGQVSDAEAPKASPPPSSSPETGKSSGQPNPAPVNSDAASTPPSPQQMLSSALQAMHQRDGFQRVMFAMLGADRKTLKGRVVLGASADDPLRQFSVPMKQGDLFTLLLSKPQPFWVNERNRERACGLVGDVARPSLNCDGFLVAPLVVHGKPLGIIYAEAAAGQNLDDAGYRRFKARCEQLNRNMEAAYGASIS